MELSIELILKRLKICNKKAVSKATGIPYERIAKWVQGKGKPKIDDYATLVDYFNRIDNSNNGTNSSNNIGSGIKSNTLKEKSELASETKTNQAMNNETLKDKLIENLLDQVAELKEELAQYKRSSKSKEAS